MQRSAYHCESCDESWTAQWETENGREYLAPGSSDECPTCGQEGIEGEATAPCSCRGRCYC